MAMTNQQARMKAMQLQSLRPELRGMAIEDVMAQIIASEGAETPGAGVGGLADIFQPARVITPSSPAPMQAVRLQAPKPTADIVPGAGADAFRRAQEVRDYTVQPATTDERSAANARVQQLIAELPTGGGERAPEVVAAMPVAAPEAAPEAAPKAQFQSRYRPLLEQAEADLQKLDAQQQAIAAQGGAAPPALVSQFENLSGKVSQLKSMVAAEEGAVVNAQRAAVLERQTQRLGREEELIKQSRRLAPGTALMEFGSALAGAKPGESFASALARGLQAGSKSYTGARDAREASLRGVEERRDALILQNEDAIEKARADAIALAKTGTELDAQQLALTKLRRDDVKSLATQQADIDLAVATAEKAQVEAKNAQAVIDAGIRESDARAYNLRQPPSSGGGSGGYTPTQLFNRANTSRVQLKELEEKIIQADEDEDYVNAEQMLRQYGVQRDVYNQNAVAAGLAPVTIRGFPVNLPNYEGYVKKKGRHPSGKTYTMPGQGGGTIVSSKPIK
jgi:hypothetical protein